MSVTKVTDNMRNVTQVDAAKITTGTIPDARIPASAVTQHVTATDLTAVHQAIATLGLHTAVSDNKAAFNLPNAFIDTFEDDTGITTETTVDRDSSGEYVASVYSSLGTPAYVTGNRSATITVTSSGMSIGDGVITNFVNGSIANGSANGWHWNTSTPSAGAYMRFQFSTSQLVTEAKWYGAGSTDCGNWKWQGSDDASSWTDIGSSFAIITSAEANQTIHTELSGNTTSYLYYQMLYVSGTVSSNEFQREIEFKQAGSTTTTNATGTLISDTQTAPSATTEASGVILYTDAEGTNTLGTDLKIYFTADNGSNWTEAASYGTAQTFSGTTKQVKLGKTTVTSGTAVALKGVWANQVATTAGGYDSGDRSSTITVTTNISNSSGTPSNLVDGAEATNSSDAWDWSTASIDSSSYLRFQFTTGFVCTGVKWVHGNSGSTGLGTWQFQGSNNGSSWTNIGSTWVSAGPTSRVEEEITTMSANTTSYTYYQWASTTTVGSNGNPWHEEMYFKEAGVTGKVAQLNGWAVNY